jgi:glycosyltransferase involved in cell wall biosynthesis
MKVLHCISTMSGGGAERQLSMLARGLVAADCEVHVALLRGGANLETLKNSGATIHHLKGRGNYDPGIFLQLLSLIRALRPDVIQTWLPQMDVLGGLAALLSRVPLITTERNSAKQYADDWRKSLRSFVTRHAALAVANSEAGKDYCLRVTGDESRVRVIRNIVPVSEISAWPVADPAASGLDADAELIIYAGRFEQMKNLENLIPALRLVMQRRERAVAWLFGEGTLKEAVRQKVAADPALARVRVMDYAADLWSWIKVARVFTLVSYTEGQPNAVFEAVACQCPVVISDIAPHRELLGQDCACLAPVNSPEAIAEGIISCLASPAEAAMRARRALEKVASFSTEAVAREYLLEYQRITGQSRMVAYA